MKNGCVCLPFSFLFKTFLDLLSLSFTEYSFLKENFVIAK